MVRPNEPMLAEEALAPDISTEAFAETIAVRTAAVNYETAGSRVSTHGLALETLLERIEILEQLDINTTQRQTAVEVSLLPPDGKVIKGALEGVSLPTDTGFRTGAEILPTAYSDTIFGQQGKPSNVRESTAFHPSSQTLETEICRISHSSTTCNDSAIDDPNGEETPKARSMILSSRIQPVRLIHNGIEKEKSKPFPTPDKVNSERPGACRTSDSSATADSASKELVPIEASPSSSRSAVRYMREPDSKSLPDGTAIRQNSVCVSNRGLEEAAAAAVACDFPSKRRKQHETKRKRVAKSENIVSLHVGYLPSLEVHERVSIPHDHVDVHAPLLRAKTLQTRKDSIANHDLQQKSYLIIGSQSKPSSQALELLQSSINEARALFQCKKYHSLLPHLHDRKPQGRKTFKVIQAQGKAVAVRHENLVGGVKTSTVVDENRSLSKQKPMKAKKYTGVDLEQEDGNITKQRAGRSVAKGSNRNGTPGQHIVASTIPDAVAPCSGNGKEDIEIATTGRAEAENVVDQADHFSDPPPTKHLEVSGVSSRDEVPSDEGQRHLEQVAASIENTNGRDDATLEGASSAYDSCDDIIKRSEVVLARREKSFTSHQHQQPKPSPTITDRIDPINPYTNPNSHRSIKVVTPSSTQTSRKRRRANWHQPGARANMSNSRSAIVGARGRPQVRPSSQDESVVSTSWPSRAPSVASSGATRRPRGFQPAEVGKSKSNLNAEVTSLAPPKAENVTQSRTPTAIQRSNSSKDNEVIPTASQKEGSFTQSQASATPQTPPHIKAPNMDKTMKMTAPAHSEVLTAALLAQTPEKQSQVIEELLAKATPKTPSPHLRRTQPPQRTVMPGSVAQTVEMDDSRPEHDHDYLKTNNAPSPSDTSSVQIIVNDEDEPQQSYWTRAATIDTAPAPDPGWDNSMVPIDKPYHMRGPTLLPPGYKGPVNANLRNLPPYKNIGSKDSGPPSTPKQLKGTSAPKSFSRQLANIQQTLQQPTTPEPWASTSANHPQSRITSTPSMDQESAQFSPYKLAAKVPPHLRAQGASPITAINNSNHASNGEVNRHPAHQRGSAKSNDGDDDIQAGRATIAAMEKYTPPPHLQGRIENKASLISDLPAAVEPFTHHAEAAFVPSINIEEEVAAQLAVDTENDAQIAAAVAASDPHGDEKFAADLQAEIGNDQFVGTETPARDSKSRAGADIRPPHLRASKPQKLASATEATSSFDLPAAVRSNPITFNNDTTAMKSHSRSPKESTEPRQIPQDNYTIGLAPHSGALKDVTKLRQNGKVSSSAEGLARSNGTESAAKKGKKPAKQTNIDNDVANLIGWDGKMMPAPLGEDWQIRPQHDPKGQDKLAAIKTWTVDHAVDTKADVVAVQDRLASPIRVPYPATKPNPDEFNQAKRHLNTDDHIQAYKAKHSSPSVGNTTPSSRGRMTKEEKRDAKKRLVEEERNRVYAPNEHAPQANIYLRPAEFKDMRQVCFLHNHYILKTACAHQLEEENELYWRNRLQETKDEGNPFLVAVHMGKKPINDVRDVHRKKSETIIGFAFTADYGLDTHAYLFTVELEMWVHQDHLHQGIGRSMLDRVLAALDPGYNLLECAPFLGADNFSRWSGGSHKLVKTILVNSLYNDDNKKDVEWKKKWLSDKNDFKICGTLPGMGQKFDRDVHIAQMILRTSAAMPKQ